MRDSGVLNEMFEEDVLVWFGVKASALGAFSTALVAEYFSAPCDGECLRWWAFRLLRLWCSLTLAADGDEAFFDFDESFASHSIVGE